MSENKKKAVRKEILEKDADDVLKPIRKNKVKETKGKFIEEAFEEIDMPEEDVVTIKEKAPKKVIEQDKTEVAVETQKSESEISVDSGSVGVDTEEGRSKKIRKEKDHDM